MRLSIFLSELYNRKGLLKNTLSPSDWVGSKSPAPDRNNANSILKPNDQRINRLQKLFPLGKGIENTTLPFRPWKTLLLQHHLQTTAKETCEESKPLDTVVATINNCDNACLWQLSGGIPYTRSWWRSRECYLITKDRQTIVTMTKTTNTKWMSWMKRMMSKTHQTHYKPTETLQFTRNLGVKYGFIKGEAIRLLRTNSSKNTSEEGLLLKNFFFTKPPIISYKKGKIP